MPFCSFHVKCSTFNQFLWKKRKSCQYYILSCHGIAVPVSWGGLWFDPYRPCCSHIMQCRAVPLHDIVSTSEQRNEAFAWNSTCNLAATIFFFPTPPTPESLATSSGKSQCLHIKWGLIADYLWCIYVPEDVHLGSGHAGRMLVGSVNRAWALADVVCLDLQHFTWSVSLKLFRSLCGGFQSSICEFSVV